MVNGQDLAAASATFTSQNGVISAINSSDDFIIGISSMSYGGSGTEHKVFFDKSLGAFRAGRIGNTNWDETNLGSYSVAFASFAATLSSSSEVTLAN